MLSGAISGVSDKGAERDKRRKLCYCQSPERWGLGFMGHCGHRHMVHEVWRWKLDWHHWHLGMTTAELCDRSQQETVETWCNGVNAVTAAPPG